MKARDFCYWLQGYFEILGAAPDDVVGNLDEKRVEVIRNHLAMVFKHEIDPSNGTVQHNQELAKLHNPMGSGGTSGTYKLDPTTVMNC